MKCLKCQFENPEGAKFCNECGQKLEEAAQKPEPSIEAERKHVTVLFSDLSGYTAMTERLDPEEVKEIMGQIFGKIASVVNKYDGTIEKFIGDAAVAFFGVPKTHEDDPVRAIRAAREIDKAVAFVSLQFESKVGKHLTMHTGINTGLVVTGEVTLEKGTIGVTGDTVNLASRLSGLAKPGEILVGQETYHQAEGYFDFETLEPIKVKGKSEAVKIYKVLSLKEEATKIHRLSGRRADLIGRKGEMAKLGEAINKLREGKGSILSVSGEAGTGKTRLIEDFKATLDLQNIQWREGHAYAYSQNIPYFPLIDLLNRAWRIEEGFLPEKVRERVELGINDIGVKQENVKNVIPYVGSLYSLSYPEIEGVSPEYWKTHLQEAIQTVFEAFVQRKPTVICLEDLHWADPSSIDLIHFILSRFRYPALFLFVYRPPFNLLPSHLLSEMGEPYQEIRLQDLSMSEAYDMVKSLLKTKAIPVELKKFVQEKVEGNPFYLEEVMNALIETGTLIRDNGSWKLARPITESNVPSTIQGVISARVDRLEKESKQILQEASVIGRAFIYKLLLRITELKDPIDRCLDDLKALDLIRIRSLQPELEYIFKHALTQETVYSGLLKKERQAIHERIALAMEQLFRERLPEFYEALGFHFKRGSSIDRAVDYLMKAGEKSLARYAVEEADQYYEQAYQIISAKTQRTKEDASTLIDILSNWAYAFYYWGNFKKFLEVFATHEKEAASLSNDPKSVMFFGWLGLAYFVTGKMNTAYQYVVRARDMAEELGDRKGLGYALTWLSVTAAFMGKFEEGLDAGKRAVEIGKSFPSDQYLSFKGLTGIALIHMMMGDLRSAVADAQALLDYGRRHSNARSLVLGYSCMGFVHFYKGDVRSCIECCRMSIDAARDPLFGHLAKPYLGVCYLLTGRTVEAERELREVIDFDERFNIFWFAGTAHLFFAMLKIIKGQMSEGVKAIKNLRDRFFADGDIVRYLITERLLGEVYLKMVEGSGPKSFSLLARNIPFLLSNLPFADGKAQKHLKEAIRVSKEVGDKVSLGQAYLDLGLLHKKKKRTEQARKCILEAMHLFEQCEAEFNLKQASEALASLEGRKSLALHT
jgi:class 3 adenylate cyclase/tetratricopeptide (TPR) repeat protein